MFGRKEEAPVQAAVVPVTPVQAKVSQVKQPDGFIGAHITIKGDVHFEGDIRLQGRVVGNIVAVGEGQSSLHVENGAEVNGNVIVHNVKIDGFVGGSIESSELVQISATGEVSGPVKYNRLAIEAGAIIDGQLTPVESNGETEGVVEQHNVSLSSYEVQS